MYKFDRVQKVEIRKNGDILHFNLSKQLCPVTNIRLSSLICALRIYYPLHGWGSFSFVTLIIE